MRSPCKKCYKYKTPYCEGEELRKILIEDYAHDCFMDEWAWMLCEMMCGDIEEDEEDAE